MPCRQCQGIESFFDSKIAARELRRYQKRGPRKTTRLLIKAITSHGVEAGSLLDIGGGIGAIQHELIPGNMRSAISVEAAPAYLHTARQEAERRGYSGQVTYYLGDFVDRAVDLPRTDVVTLDRVLCCYPDMDALVSLSVAKARRLYGVVFPRERWIMKLAFPLMNLISRLQRSPFRVFLHSAVALDAVLYAQGFTLDTYEKTLAWQVRIYSRDPIPDNPMAG
jgi:magnesium-protoporphyrin O-methyltransferase